MVRITACTTMDTTTVHGLFVAFVLPESTISSNMNLTSFPKEQDVRGRLRYRGACFRLRVRCQLQRFVGRASDSRRPPAVQQSQNWSTFLPQSPPPEQRRQHE